MLVLRTGLPGHSKTLNTIKEVDSTAHLENRPVYFHNIADLDVTKLKANWFEFEDPFLWFELPHNSIIVVDEAQGWFGVRDSRKEVPPHCSEFETHRHKGFDVHLITQDARFLDSHVRRLSGSHIHYWRPWGMQRVARYEFEKVTDTDKQTYMKDGRKTYIKLDKSYFGVYKSAVAHNVRFKPPLKFIAIPVLVCLVAFLAYYAINRVQKPLGVDSDKNSGSMSEIDTKSTTVTGMPISGDYLSTHKPRLDGVPQSAPIYDSITRNVNEAPKLTCIFSDEPKYVEMNPMSMQKFVYMGSPAVCGCFTQQGTKQSVTFEICRSYALNGVFDPYRKGSSVINRAVHMGVKQ